MFAARTAVTAAVIRLCFIGGLFVMASNTAHSAEDGIEYLNSATVLPGNLPFSEAVRVGGTLYLSGQLGLLPGTRQLAPGGITGETRQAMDNISTTLVAHGYSLDDLVKCTVMLADIGEWGKFNEVYVTYFRKHYPARSAFGSSGLAMGARLEIECIAAK